MTAKERIANVGIINLIFSGDLALRLLPNGKFGVVRRDVLIFVSPRFDEVCEAFDKEMAKRLAGFEKLREVLADSEVREALSMSLGATGLMGAKVLAGVDSFLGGQCEPAGDTLLDKIFRDGQA